MYQKVIESKEQLKLNDRTQKEFINIAAHELRTPIQPILGLTEILRSKIKEDTEQQELLDVVIRNAKRLQELTEDILDVTKIESQFLRLNKEKFNLCEMILNTIADYRKQINKKDINNNIKLELVGSKEEEGDNDDFIVVVIVEADKARINQVIMNLLSNSIKFTKEGSITIMTKMKENQILVSIKDTGIGIDPEILPILFTKFTTKSEKGGTGLGLFIVKSIVEAHGGKIWAENNNNNTDGKVKGATFTFSLPALNTMTENLAK